MMVESHTARRSWKPCHFGSGSAFPSFFFSVRSPFMSTVRLYLFLLLGVLFVIGCGQNRSDSDTARSTPDTTASASPSTPSDTTADDGLRVVVLGNSIAAGYGVDSDEAFPARLQQKVDSLGWNVTIQNAGVSGETTAGGRRRIGWLLEDPIDILVLELGGNDGLRGVDPDATEENLTAIIDTTLSTYPDAHVLLAGMQIPPNLGADYTKQFRQVYPTVADQFDQVTLIPFVLEGVGTNEALMQDDGIHPTAEGQKQVAENVWEELRPLLEKRLERETA